MTHVAACRKHQVVVGDIWIFRKHSASQRVAGKQKEQTTQRVRQDNHGRRDRISWIVNGQLRSDECRWGCDRCMSAEDQGYWSRLSMRLLESS